MSMPLISADLQVAIERLRPKLQALLGNDYAPFAAQLDAFLAGGSENQVWNLFRRYPVAYERLQDALAQQDSRPEMAKGGFGLYGDPGPPPIHFYRCETGPHIVAAMEIEERDAVGNALCPQHHTPMVLKKRSKPSQGKE